MSMMFGPKMGTWSVESKADKRWNKSGRSKGFALGGTSDMSDWIEKCKQEYGDPPEDCIESFWKD